MSIDNYLDLKLLDIQLQKEIKIYKEDIDLDNDCKVFQGNPRRHPYDAEKIILIPDSINKDNLFFEFLKSDIAHIEELPNITDDEGVSLKQVSLWVKIGCWAVKTEGFKIK